MNAFNNHARLTLKWPALVDPISLTCKTMVVTKLLSWHCLNILRLQQLGADRGGILKKSIRFKGLGPIRLHSKQVFTPTTLFNLKKNYSIVTRIVLSASTILSNFEKYSSTVTWIVSPSHSLRQFSFFHLAFSWLSL